MAGEQEQLIRLREGVVVGIRSRSKKTTRVWVNLDGRIEKALNYNPISGPINKGDKVILNTTAVHLGLGTGGEHFVLYNKRHKAIELTEPGHIMKLRYTPLQLKVLSCEEKEGGFNPLFQGDQSIQGMPVIIGELHSMLTPLAIAIKRIAPKTRICYIMTDGAALPLYLSNNLEWLRNKFLIDATVTCGHAFGGDYEAVNLYTALVAAKRIVGAQISIVTMGPGVIGTGTRYGFSGMELGENVNKVALLRGVPIVVPRISFSDPRRRHQGISHHTLTALGEVALKTALVPLPRLSPTKMNYISGQLKETGILKKHRAVITHTETMLGYYLLLEKKDEKRLFQTMGRGIKEDPDFFKGVAAAGIQGGLRLRYMHGNKKGGRGSSGENYRKRL